MYNQSCLNKDINSNKNKQPFCINNLTQFELLLLARNFKMSFSKPISFKFYIKSLFISNTYNELKVWPCNCRSRLCRYGCCLLCSQNESLSLYHWKEQHKRWKTFLELKLHCMSKSNPKQSRIFDKIHLCFQWRMENGLTRHR